MNVLIREGAQSFFLQNNNHESCVLLIHGLTGSPAEMRPLADFIFSAGYDVYAPRLPGHGTDEEELRKTSRYQLLATVEDAWHVIENIYAKKVIIGQSLGGLLALWLTSYYRLDHTIIINTPFYLYDKRLKYLSWLRFFKKYEVKKNKRKYSANMLRYINAYEKIPLNSVHQLIKLRDEVIMLLPQISSPLLIVQSKNEHTVRPNSAEEFWRLCSSLRKDIMWLERSGHLATLDCESEALYVRILQEISDLRSK